jgi:hypothetical protein
MSNHLALNQQVRTVHTLMAAALALGVSGDEFDRIVEPEKMVGDPRGDLGLGPRQADGRATSLG